MESNPPKAVFSMSDPDDTADRPSGANNLDIIHEHKESDWISEATPDERRTTAATTTTNRFHITKSSCDLENEYGLNSRSGSQSQLNQYASTNTLKSGESSVVAGTNSTPSSMNDLNATDDHNEAQLTLHDNQRTVKFKVSDAVGDGSNENSINNANLKSLRNYKTLERPPIIDFYKNTIDPNKPLTARPSMAQLLNGRSLDKYDTVTDPLLSDAKYAKSNESLSQVTARNKFGWIEGVFFRCLLSIFGVMLYLRISFVSGQAGVLMGSVVVLLSTLVTTITALSTCAICTNGDVKGGGAYFLISRSLGPAFGGSIGIIFSFANAVSAAMCVIGFSETVRDIFLKYDFMLIDGGMNDVRIIGLITCSILMSIVFIGTGFESKMQMGLLGILTLSIVNYFVGIFLPMSNEQQVKGITGLRIMAGANISGDLADPQKAIPIGTLAAIFTSSLVYLLTVWTTGAVCVRHADGVNVPVYVNNDTSGVYGYIEPPCALNNTCPYGLLNNFNIMEMSSAIGLFILGIFAATLSSALASLVGAPKIFQAVSKDRLFPYINQFARGFGKNEEPRIAYFLGFLIAMLMILIGELNAIAPIISNFFLASYALINYACFDNSIADSPGFRPSFKYYNMWISLMGALLCIVVMFIISWVTALLTFICFGALYLYLLYRKPDVNWGSSLQAHSYKTALKGMIKLNETEDHIKNYRPQILVLTGHPQARPSLVDFANSICKGNNLMICGNIIRTSKNKIQNLADLNMLNIKLTDWLSQRDVKCFVSSIARKSIREGASHLTETTGLGRLKTDVALFGFKCNWAEVGQRDMREVNEYFGMIQDFFESNRNGLDFSEMMKQLKIGEHEEIAAIVKNEQKEEETRLIENEETVKEEESGDKDNSYLDINAYQNDEEEISNLEASVASSNSNLNNPSPTANEIEKGNGSIHLPSGQNTVINCGINSKINSFMRRSTRRPTAAQKELLVSINRFKNKVKQPRVDVWWLFDDGGLTLLIPYLLSIPKSYLENAQLRVFTVSASSGGIEQMQRGMAGLLNKFRIKVGDVHVISDITRKPRDSTMDQFNKLIEPFRCVLSDNSAEGMISDAELHSQKDKTNRQLRTAELLRELSKEADLICITLPVPRKNMVSSALYLSWLDMMTRDLPTTLLIRGNQTSVLTFSA
uniref:Solute carrier family 12 member 1 n=1 Tax=Rhabditophanes sp. KR3021 TaxID=114890 RepID=A0AC35TQF4_9BILA